MYVAARNGGCALLEPMVVSIIAEGMRNVPAQGQAAWPRSLILELYVLVGGERAHPDVGDSVLGDARADAHQRAQVHHRRVHHPIDGQLLDLVEQLLALLGVPLVRLLLEELVDVRIAAVSIGALRLDEAFHPAGCVTRSCRPPS